MLSSQFLYCLFFATIVEPVLHDLSSITALFLPGICALIYLYSCLSMWPVYRLLPTLPGTVCRGFQLIVRWKTSLTQIRPVCYLRTLSSGLTMRLRLQPIMEQAGVPTATKSLSGHCKEVRQHEVRQRLTKSFANSIHYLEHQCIHAQDNDEPAAKDVLRLLIGNPIICFKWSN